MSEITKLYENAGIEKVIKYECTYDYGIACPNYNETCGECFYYKEKEPEYPDFTAEKQLELIKWLASSHKGILISDMGEGESEFNISTGFYYCAKHIQNFRKNKDLSVVIAEFVNNLWQDLTEEERQQIKEILE